MTLMRKDEDDRTYRDCDAPQRANPDAAEFYRSVAHMLHLLHREGHNVSYLRYNHYLMGNLHATERGRGRFSQKAGRSRN